MSDTSTPPDEPAGSVVPGPVADALADVVAMLTRSAGGDREDALRELLETADIQHVAAAILVCEVLATKLEQLGGDTQLLLRQIAIARYHL